MVQGGGFTAALVEKPTRAPILNEATNGLRNLRGTLAHGAHARASQRDVAVLLQRRRTTVSSITAGTHPPISATPSSAGCSPGWTSSTRSRNVPVRTAGDIDAAYPVRAGRDHRCQDPRRRSSQIQPCRRPLLVIFLTIFVNLVGFGIIIPLLPFYARDVRRVAARHRPAVRVVFDRPAGCVAAARRFVGSLGPAAGADLQPHRNRRELRRCWPWRRAWPCSLPRGSSTACRAATSRPRAPTLPTSPPRRTARRAFGMLGAAFGLGFIVGPALGALFSHISYTAPIWAAAAITVVATALALFWLPETVHRAHAGGGSPWKALRESEPPAAAPRLLFGVDFLYWMAFAVYQTTFALFGARRFGFDAAHTGYLLSAFGVLGVVVQGVLVGPVVALLGDRRTLIAGLVFAAFGWGGSALTHSLPVFVAMLVPGAIGIGFCNATLSTLISNAAGPHEQGRVQGAAGALESLGRTLGPVWGNGALQVFGEGNAFGTAAVVLLGAAALTMR